MLKDIKENILRMNGNMINLSKKKKRKIKTTEKKQTETIELKKEVSG